MSVAHRFRKRESRTRSPEEYRALAELLRCNPYDEGTCLYETWIIKTTQKFDLRPQEITEADFEKEWHLLSEQTDE